MAKRESSKVGSFFLLKLNLPGTYPLHGDLLHGLRLQINSSKGKDLDKLEEGRVKKEFWMKAWDVE